jgi:hypothetical protein
MRHTGRAIGHDPAQSQRTSTCSPGMCRAGVHGIHGRRQAAVYDEHVAESVRAICIPLRMRCDALFPERGAQAPPGVRHPTGFIRGGRGARRGTEDTGKHAGLASVRKESPPFRRRSIRCARARKSCSRGKENPPPMQPPPRPEPPLARIVELALRSDGTSVIRLFPQPGRAGAGHRDPPPLVAPGLTRPARLNHAIPPTPVVAVHSLL